MTGFPIPDPNPSAPPFESWMFALLFIGGLGFIFWWIVTMLPEQIIAFKEWKRTRMGKT